MNPKKKKGKYSLFIVVIGLVIVLLDIFLQTYYRFSNFGVANSGVSFGLAQNISFWVLIVPAIIFLGYMTALIRKGMAVNVFLIVLGFGAIGNMLPRLIFGDVWDYIYFNSVGLWVNLSDLLISFSVLSYILSPDGTANTI